MKKVAIIMGSDSDLPTAEKAATELKKLEIPFEVHVMSAHRTPDEASAFSKTAEENGFGVIISIAGMAAHLGASSGNVRGDLPDAGHRYPDAHHVPRRTRLPVLHRTDAVRHSRSYGGFGRRQKRRNSRGSNACSLRRLSSGEAARYEKRNGRSGS